MRNILKLIVSSQLFTAALLSDLSASELTFAIHPDKDTLTISPYIYGSNGFNRNQMVNSTVARQGGNRLTGYNWENNASNAGIDWKNSSDGYLNQTLIPGKAVTDFVDSCRVHNEKSLITVPMAGYVAADKKGTVLPTEVAPSARWKQVVFSKGSPLSLVPDTTDNAVYIDEMVSFLVNRYKKSSEGGILAYSLDNEPGLWSSTHPLIQPTGVTCKDLIDKSIACAKAIKSQDESAMVFGPALYGYSAFVNLQGASDWNSVKSSYTWFIDYYLDQMKKASDKAGYRLLDVLDVHWYPEAQGDGQRILGNNPEVSDPITDGANEARMQAPRSLYDTDYKETSWIANMLGKPIGLYADIQKSIDTYYPGTKLAITEFSFGAANHISGGIATADFLGAAGKNNLFMTNKWYPNYGFSAAAYKIFRNYNTANAGFGSTSCFASTTNREISSVYSSYDKNDKSTLHIVAINKASSPKTVTCNISGTVAYRSGGVWGFDRLDSTITVRTSVSLLNNSFEYSLPPLSVLHFVLDSSTVSINTKKVSRLNSSTKIQNKTIVYTTTQETTLSVVNPAGRTLLTRVLPIGAGVVSLSELPKGLYFLSIQNGVERTFSKFSLAN